MDSPEERQPPDVITSDTENATTIQPEEAPPGKQLKFRKFRAYNTGTWNGPKRENKDVIYHQDNLHRYDAISTTLGLTTAQKKRGRKIVDSINLGEFNKGSEGIDHVIFGICVLLANDDVQDGTRYWPHPNSEVTDSSFSDFAEELGLSLNDQMSVIERVRARTEL